MDKVTPGKFRLRGMFLFELYVVSLFLLKKESESSSSSSASERLPRLEALRTQLSEAEEILSWEPPQSVEGRRCAVARDYATALDNMVEACRRAAQDEQLKRRGGASARRKKGR